MFCLKTLSASTTVEEIVKTRGEDTKYIYIYIWPIWHVGMIDVNDLDTDP